MISISMMSFTDFVKPPVLKVGTNMFEVSSKAEFTKAEKEIIKSFIMEQYDLKEWDTKAEYADFDMLTQNGRRNNWILKRKAFLTVIDERLITWQELIDGGGLGEGENEVLAILNKYSR